MESSGSVENGKNLSHVTLGEALTTIISHFVISDAGLTPNRVGILGGLLNELKKCSTEELTIIQGLEQLLHSVPVESGDNTGILDSKSNSLNFIQNNDNAALSGSVSMALVQSILLKQSDGNNDVTEKPYIIEEPVWKDSHYGKILEEGNQEDGEKRTEKKKSSLSRKRQKIAGCNDAVNNILTKQRTVKLKLTPKDKKDTVYGLCIWCDQLTSTTSLPEHTRLFHNAIDVQQKFVCPLCKTEIKVFSLLVQHISDLPSCCPSDISDKAPIKCPLCCETILKVETLKEHFSLFHNVKLDKSQQPYASKRMYPFSSFWSCMYCGISEHNKTALTSHIKIYHYPRANHYCRFCGHVYHKMAALHKHLVIQHKNGLNETLIDYYNLIADKSSETSGIIDFLKQETMCYYCDLEFKDYSSFNNHFKETHRNSANLKLLCCFCPESYNSRDNLWIHVKTSHVLANLDFIEPSVKKSFLVEMLTNFQEVLKKDVSTNLERGEFADITSVVQNMNDMKCPLCNENMKDDKHIHEHHEFIELINFFKEKIGDSDQNDFIRSMSENKSWSAILDQCADSKEGKVKCLMCTEVVFDKPNFYLHLVVTHFCGNSDNRCMKCYVNVEPNQKDTHDDFCRKLPSAVNQLKCTECNFSADDSADLADHMNAHVVKVHLEPVRCGRLQCSLCSDKFSRKRDLRRHVMMKHAFGSGVSVGTDNVKGGGDKEKSAVGEMVEEANTSYRSTKSTAPVSSFDSNDSELFTSTDFIDISIVGSLDND